MIDDIGYAAFAWREMAGVEFTQLSPQFDPDRGERGTAAVALLSALPQPLHLVPRIRAPARISSPRSSIIHDR